LTGTPTTSTVRLLLFANMAGFWFIQNNTPNPVTVVTAVGGSTGITVMAGANLLVRSDGTNVFNLATSQPVRNVTAAGAITVGPTDSIVLVNKTVPAITAITLPATGGPFTIIDSAGVCNTFPYTVTVTGGGLINGQASFFMNINYEAVTFVPNGSGYNII
jgi:hypothetical protein